MTETMKAIEQLERISRNLGSIGETEDYTDMAIKALEEVQQYHAIGTTEEFLRNKDFLSFLTDKMNPNDFETYLRMYNALNEMDDRGIN